MLWRASDWMRISTTLTRDDIQHVRTLIQCSQKFDGSNRGSRIRIVCLIFWREIGTCVPQVDILLSAASSKCLVSSYWQQVTCSESCLSSVVKSCRNMDYRGQQFCDNIYYLITILFGVMMKVCSSHKTCKSNAGSKLKTFHDWYFVYVLFQVTSWIAGYIAGDFSVTFYGWLVGLGISLVVSSKSLGTIASCSLCDRNH